MNCDVLVVGTGVAGLTFAIKTAIAQRNLNIVILTKTELQETNTTYAQGGVAAVWNLEKDSFEKHVADTHDAGDGLCDPKIVEIVINEGPERVREIIEWGTRFDKEQDRNTYNLGMEGGHSDHRILHYIYPHPEPCLHNCLLHVLEHQKFLIQYSLNSLNYN